MRNLPFFDHELRVWIEVDTYLNLKSRHQTKGVKSEHYFFPNILLCIYDDARFPKYIFFAKYQLNTFFLFISKYEPTNSKEKNQDQFVLLKNLSKDWPKLSFLSMVSHLCKNVFKLHNRYYQIYSFSKNNAMYVVAADISQLSCLKYIHSVTILQHYVSEFCN